MSEKRYRKQANIKISGEHKEKLTKLAQSTKMPQKMIAEHLIDLAEEFDFMASGMEDRIKKADQKRTSYTRLDGACKAMTYAGEYFICVFGHADKPPTIKKLAKDEGQALDICASADCEARLEMKLKNEEYRNKIKVLENTLQTRSTDKFKIPICHQGATLSEDCKEFTGCPKNPGQPVSIDAYCKKLRSGEGCGVYAERVVGVGAKP